MIRLSDLSVRDASSWADAAARFSWPAPASYNIGADCLGRPGDVTALIEVGADGPRRITFAELGSRSGRLVAGLMALGLQPGDRVVVKLGQGADLATAVLAVLSAGGIVVPVSNVLAADAVRHRLTDSRPRIMIAAGTEVETVLAAEAGAVLVSTGRALDELIAGANGPAPFAATSPDTPAMLLYTSGTTGKSKGVVHAHRVLLGHHGIDYALNFIRPADVAYSPVDWAWAGGLLLGLLVPLAHGIPVVAFRESRFTAGRVLGVLRDCGVSVGLFPPTALRLLRQSGEVTPAMTRSLRLRCLVTGAEAVEPDLLEWARADLRTEVSNAFGQTEANALIGHSRVLGQLDPACLGKPYPGHQVCLLDENLRPVPAGEPGQIAVRADDPVAMVGYWHAQAATEAKVAAGWLLTGDIGQTDQRGQFFFHGRDDDIIKSGGYRLGPAEIEAALLADPSVAECAVVGLPDLVRGQAVTAFVRLRPDQRRSPDLAARLQERVRSAVGPHAVPRAIHFVADLPWTSTGKISRAALRTQI
ncbi:MAG TPA: AMP-binding protein [Streptosporangiaceae bacterium]|nr:AMP-binding protein [Streptosporangiaceae bacterium]